MRSIRPNEELILYGTRSNVVCISLAVVLFLCPGIDAQEGDPTATFNTDMIETPEGEVRGKGKIETFNQGRKDLVHLFIPEGVESNRKSRRYPLIVCYHGGAGHKAIQQLKVCKNASTDKFPVFVLSPEPYDFTALTALLKEDRFPIDRRRIACFGGSSGGMAVMKAVKWYLSDPKAFPFCALAPSSSAIGYAKGMPRVSFMVLAGEYESPGHETSFTKKYPFLLERRMHCRNLYNKIITEIGDLARYIELPERGHQDCPEQGIATGNLIRSMGISRFEFDPRKVDPLFDGLVAAARAEDWSAVKRLLDELRAKGGSFPKGAFKSLERKVRSAFHKMVKAEVKVITAVSPRTPHYDVTAALAVFDRLRKAQEAFAGTGFDIAREMKKVERARYFQRELEARKKFRDLIAAEQKTAREDKENWNQMLRPDGEHAARFRALQASFGDTEYGGNRCRERLKALEPNE